MGWKNKKQKPKTKKQKTKTPTIKIRSTLTIEVHQEKRIHKQNITQFESPVRGEILVANATDKDKESRRDDI